MPVIVLKKVSMSISEELLTLLSINDGVGSISGLKFICTFVLLGLEFSIFTISELNVVAFVYFSKLLSSNSNGKNRYSLGENLDE
jgi:hypothetical protein